MPLRRLLGATFGDNDNLSALIANLVDADVLMLLTDVNGLYTANPVEDPAAQHVPLVRRVDGSVERMAGKTVAARSRGGMPTKIQAAKMATASGVAVIIADGQEPEVLSRLAAGENVGTLLPSHSQQGREPQTLDGVRPLPPRRTSGGRWRSDGAAVREPEPAPRGGQDG